MAARLLALKVHYMGWGAEFDDKAMSTSKETGSKGQFDPPQQLSFNQTPCGSQAKIINQDHGLK